MNERLPRPSRRLIMNWQEKNYVVAPLGFDDGIEYMGLAGFIT